MSLESAISNLVNRLEAVTARLEKVEKQVVSGASAPAATSSSSSSSSSGGSDSASVTSFDALIAEHVRPFVELSGKIAPEVKQIADLFLKAVEEQRKTLILASKAKKPSDADLQVLLKPTSDFVQEIIALRDKQRTSKFFNNLSAVSEGASALFWVAVSPTPAPHVKDMRAGSEFYSNRLLKDFKDKDQTQVDWVKHYNGFLKELEPYVKQNHTTGLTWNANGGDAKSLASSVSSSSSSSAAAAPKAPGGPPPPMPSAPLTGAPSTASKGVDMSNVLSSLSKGTEVTSGLKKVTDDMKTKNRPTEERSSVVKADAIKTHSSSKKSEEKSVSRPPKLSLEGNKWVVEFQVNNPNIKIEETETKHTIYIFRCENSTIQVSGKVNTIILDACKKVGLVFSNAISGVEIVNCQNIEVQVTGKVPNVAIDKTTGIQLYLSKDTLDSEIVSSKSSEMNVLIPGKEEGSDLVELPVPEQYKTIVKGGKLITESVQHV